MKPVCNPCFQIIRQLRLPYALDDATIHCSRSSIMLAVLESSACSRYVQYIVPPLQISGVFPRTTSINKHHLAQAAIKNRTPSPSPFPPPPPCPPWDCGSCSAPLPDVEYAMASYDWINPRPGSIHFGDSPFGERNIVPLCQKLMHISQHQHTAS